MLTDDTDGILVCLVSQQTGSVSHGELLGATVSDFDVARRCECKGDTYAGVVLSHCGE